MVELRADEIFLIHPKIRWGGLTTNKGQIIFSKMRPGVESYTPEEDDRFLLEFGALIMNGITQRSGPWLGNCEYVTVAYEKATQLILCVKEKYLALTVDKSVPCDEIAKIAKSVLELKT